MGSDGTAFRTRQACISNDFPGDRARRSVSRRQSQRRVQSRRGVSAAGRRRRAEGVLLFNSSNATPLRPNSSSCCSGWRTTSSFALGNFDRADEKARAEEQKQRLTRMFEALSATNEAIMRAKSRARAVRTGLRGRRASAANSPPRPSRCCEPGEDFLEIVATAGPDRARAKRCAIVGRSPAVPKGRASPGSRSARDNLASSTTISAIRHPRAFLRRRTRQRDPIRRGFAAAEERRGDRRAAVSLQRARCVQPEI